MIRDSLTYSCDCGLPVSEELPETKMDEFLHPHFPNLSQAIDRNKTVAEGDSSQLLKWFIDSIILYSEIRYGKQKLQYLHHW